MNKSTRLRTHDDEQIALTVRPSPFWTMGGLVFSLGLYELWRRRNLFVVTDQRIIHAKGILNKTHKTVSLDRIQDVNLSTTIIVGSRVSLSTAGGTLSIRSTPTLTRANARSVADAIESRIQARAQSGTV